MPSHDWIGAVDGTHVTAIVPRSQAPTYMGSKHYISQNVLAAVDFDLWFTYVLAGWEGSTHDANILAWIDLMASISLMTSST